jgi:hypothetical protein
MDILLGRWIILDPIANLAERNEARIMRSCNVLLVLSVLEGEPLIGEFCGTVLTSWDVARQRPELSGKTVYLCGDLSRAMDLAAELKLAERVFVISELSHGHRERDDGQAWSTIGVGQVPVLVSGVGVFFRRYFDPDIDYFSRISGEHDFQHLTESTKPGQAYRTGIYLTPVKRIGAELHFRLLRCSTNLSGPTDNFRATDAHIVGALNQESARIFEGSAPLNHVLAQIYRNTPATETRKQTKARIKAHADKTKDMPDDGIMAFCTFYDGLDKLQPLPDDPLDYGHKQTSGLTRLVFRLKKSVSRQLARDLPAHFTVPLYPGSVFLMPLSTNRWYAHEIRPSTLEASRLPTRLGYVVRCSSGEAVHTNGQTFLTGGGARVPLQPPSREGMGELRRFYAEENRTADFIDYADRFPFSMNGGDYMAPGYHPADEFRQYAVPLTDNPFRELSASTRFQSVSRGRQGMVLVRSDDERGTPIVRTTTRYNIPAQCFRAVHVQLAEQLQRIASLPFQLNNALIERYSNAYTTMGSHSDQALDLEEGSSIALFSCYKHPERANPPRVLVVESKDPGGDRFEIPLTHNSVVVFSLDTNSRFKHKIVLKDAPGRLANEWLGITLRTSQTFVQYDVGEACFEDGTPLVLGNDEQKQAFYSLRRRENHEPGFAYPPMPYTLSESDLMAPTS